MTGYLIVFFDLQATAGFASLLELLDIIAQADEGFDISGGFKATWRAHVWEGNFMFIVYI